MNKWEQLAKTWRRHICLDYH